MDFKSAYAAFMKRAFAKCSGERRRRLEEHGHAERYFLEKVWWELFGQFDHLQPEYEVVDERGRSRFLDFAYLMAWYKIAFEINGYGPHLKQASRWSYSDEQQRIRFLSSTGWILMYFSYDEIRDHPERCIAEIQALLGRLFGGNSADSVKALKPVEKAIIQSVIAKNGTARVGDICRHMSIHRNTAYKYLRELTEEGWLIAVGDKYKTAYKLNAHMKRLFPHQ